MSEEDFTVEETTELLECKIVKVTPLKDGVSFEFIATPKKTLKIRKKK